MSSLVRQSVASHERSAGVVLAVPALALILLGAFLLAPGSVAEKTHAALHGLCAQRPSHSLRLGNEALPMDARMTGIYLGAAATGIWLLALGRFRAAGAAPRRVLVLLGLFVVVMGIDGLNALLFDLNVPHPYEPSNGVRLASGILAGTSLGASLSYLFAISIWRRGQRQCPIIAGASELIVPVGVSAALGVAALSGLPMLYGPFAVGLVVATAGVIWILIIVLAALVSNRAWSIATFQQLAPLALVALLGTVLTIGALAWVRFLAEQSLGLPNLT